MLMFMVYLASLCGAVKELCGILLVILGIVGGVIAIWYGLNSNYECWRCGCGKSLKDDAQLRFGRLNKLYIWFVAFIAVLFCITPGHRTVYTMLGVGLTEDAIASPLGQKVLAIVNKQLDEYLLEDGDKE